MFKFMYVMNFVCLGMEINVKVLWFNNKKIVFLNIGNYQYF